MALSFITRVLILILGYAYPAYDCYKALEKNKPQIEQLRFWCQYWILIAALTVLERFADCVVSWLPLYGEAKLALIVYLWYPKTRGAGHVYGKFFQPLLSKHEADIDRSLLEIRTKTKDMTATHLKATAAVGQTLILDAIRRVSTQVQSARSGSSGQAPDEGDEGREKTQ